MVYPFQSHIMTACGYYTMIMIKLCLNPAIPNRRKRDSANQPSMFAQPPKALLWSAACGYYTMK